MIATRFNNSRLDIVDFPRESKPFQSMPLYILMLTGAIEKLTRLVTRQLVGKRVGH